MSKSTWADVVKGDAVEIAGRTWAVTKYKKLAAKSGKPKKAVVRLERKGRRSDGEVRLKDPVKRARRSADTDEKRPALHDRNGAQNRWATDRELADVLGRGDAAQRKPPAKAKGEAWQGKKTGVERVLEKALGARLVGETRNEDAGYYVPPVDVSTVAAHLAIFHGGIPSACNDAEGAMLKAHDAQHAGALQGQPLAVNHWHTEKRP